MTDQEVHLTPIRINCQKLIETNDSKYSEELIKTTKKGPFFVHHTFNIVLDSLIQNPAGDKTERFRVLDYIFYKGSVERKDLLAYTYKFSLQLLKIENASLEILNKAFEYGKLTDVLNDRDAIPNYISYIDLWATQNKIVGEEFTKVIYSNYRALIKHCSDMDSLQQKLFRSLQRVTIIFKEKAFLTDVVFKGFQACSDFKIKSNEVFFEYVDFVEYAFKNDTKSAWKITEVASKCLSKTEHITMNGILSRCMDTFSNEKITTGSLNELCQNYFKSATSSTTNIVQHKVLQVISRVFCCCSQNLELTEKSFLSGHDFVFKLFNLLKYIKNNPKGCCNDIKRHQIFDLAIVMINYSIRLINSGVSSMQIQKRFQYYLDYALVLYKQIECPSKQQLFKNLRNSFQRVSGMINENKSMISNVSFIAQIYKVYIHLEETQQDTMDLDRLISTGYLFLYYVCDADKKENEQICAEALLFTILFSLKLKNDTNIQKNLVKLVNRLHEATKVLDYKSVYDYAKKKTENSELAKYAKEICFEELIILEMEAINRHKRDNFDDIIRLFSMAVENTTDIEYLARACLTLTDKHIKVIGLQKFKDLNARLEKSYACDVQNSENFKLCIALASNYYFISFIEGDKLETKVSTMSKDLLVEIPDCLSLQNEVKIVNHMDKFQEYAMEILLRLRQNPKLIENFSSPKLFRIMLENISTQYFVRGIANKDLETKLILWHFLQYQENLESLLETSSFFLDNLNRLIGNSGQYINISKQLNYLRIEDIIPKANKALDDFLEDISNKTEGEQARALNYMISLWTYYMLMGRRSDASKIWEKFVNTSNNCTLKRPLYVCIIDAKKYVALAEINIKCFKKNTVDYLYKAIVLLKEIKTVYTDFSNNFQFLFRTLVLKTVNYSLNRMVDIEHYTIAMLTLKNQAVKKGLFFKTLELYSLSVLRNLNMELLDDAKTDLKKMSTMLKLNEDILIEIPISMKPTILTPSFEHNEIIMRKAIPNTASSRKSTIEIFNDSRNDNNELMEQLEKFVHEYRCKCSVCQYPQLKFILFQMGCHYSRLLFMMKKFVISKSYNEMALEPWRHYSMKILRSKECGSFDINKQDFVNFSIRWLFQVADTFIKVKDYSSVEDIHTEIELLCTNNIEDYECIKESLRARIGCVDFLIKQENQLTKVVTPKQLDFNEFSKVKNVKPSSSFETAKKTNKAVIKKISPKDDSQNSVPKERAVTSKTKIVELSHKKLTKSTSVSSMLKSTSSKTNLAESVIYIDSGESDQEKSKPKKTIKAPAKTTRSTKPKVPEIDLTNDTPRTRLKRCL